MQLVVSELYDDVTFPSCLRTLTMKAALVY